MHTAFGKLFRYVLWLILIAIVLLLLVGLAKNNRDVKGYIQSLNQKSWSEAWNQGGIGGIFWGETVSSTEFLVPSTGDLELGTGNLQLLTGIDVYDPAFEEGLNQIPQDTLSSGDYGDVQTDFGFVNNGSGAAPEATVSGESKSQQLLDLVKQREMNK